MLSRKLIFLVILFTNFSVFAASKDLKTETDKISYSIGASIGADLKRQELDIKSDILYQGIQDSLKGKLILTDKEMEEVIVSYQQKQAKIQQAKIEKLAKENLKKGSKFLDNNKKSKGVVTTESGLQYKVIKEGKGKQPISSDTVTVNYKGTLIDGTEFDSSYKRNQPATFRLDQVIEGWQEGLKLMKPGSKYQLFVPAKLAYGEKGINNAIQPNSVLIFEVELLKVEQQN